MNELAEAGAVQAWTVDQEDKLNVVRPSQIPTK